jgi:hypothetical protein
MSKRLIIIFSWCFITDADPIATIWMWAVFPRFIGICIYTWILIRPPHFDPEDGGDTAHIHTVQRAGWTPTIWVIVFLISLLFSWAHWEFHTQCNFLLGINLASVPADTWTRTHYMSIVQDRCTWLNFLKYVAERERSKVTGFLPGRVLNHETCFRYNMTNTVHLAKVFFFQHQQR